ncbi:MAG: phosphate acyltransferase [Chitinispirillaceae bacterium]|jgi:glycerol-3-phosphate acyltransferase PlsX|nr:phosphate acyltransferase [Chitinispirillaceae bacterium]
MDSAGIAIDLDGGDFGSTVVLQGVLDALQDSPAPFTAHLCGDRAQIEKLLSENTGAVEKFRDSLVIEHCPERVSTYERFRSMVWKNQTNSSIIRCITLQKEGFVQATVSAGDTAVLMVAAFFILGRQRGALRPALAACLPTVKKKPVLLLDVGANLNCRREHLVSFAFLGREYMRLMSGIENPKVALLNIGMESVKGTPVIRDADRTLQKRCPSYQGFTEGNHVLSGDSDVIVCDGFAGNVLLKACESFHLLIESVVEGDKELLARMRRKMASLDGESYGGVPLLGIKGIVLKAHGSSSPRAIRSAVLAAVRAIRHRTEKN